MKHSQIWNHRNSWKIWLRILGSKVSWRFFTWSSSVTDSLSEKNLEKKNQLSLNFTDIFFSADESLFSTTWSDSKIYDEKLNPLNDEIEVSASKYYILQSYLIIILYFEPPLFLQEDISQNGTNYNETLMQRLMSPNKIRETFQSFHVDSPASQMTPLYEPSEVEKLVRAGKIFNFHFKSLPNRTLNPLFSFVQTCFSPFQKYAFL